MVEWSKLTFIDTASLGICKTSKAGSSARKSGLLSRPLSGTDIATSNHNLISTTELSTPRTLPLHQTQVVSDVALCPLRYMAFGFVYDRHINKLLFYPGKSFHCYLNLFRIRIHRRRTTNERSNWIRSPHTFGWDLLEWRGGECVWTKPIKFVVFEWSRIAPKYASPRDNRRHLGGRENILFESWDLQFGK